MKMNWILLAIGSASGIALATAPVHTADLRPFVVTNITGTLHIVQKIPCDTLTKDTPVTEGRIVIGPAEGFDVPGGKSFVLTGYTISFAPFTLSGSCRGVAGSRTYNLLSVQLGQAVAFTAFDRGGGVFAVTIPKDEFLLYEAAVVDGRFSEKGYAHPSQDVTGTIDLTRGTLAMQAVVARSIRILDEEDPGTLTVDLSGTIAFPDTDGDGVPDRADNCRFVANPDQTIVDTTPPTVTCRPNGPPRGTFRVSAFDACDVPTVRLGSFVLTIGERIKIEEGGQSGVTLINDVGPDRVKHFHVGKGQAVITATDASHNSARASCK